MHPVLFRVPGTGWPVGTFNVLVALGFLLGLWVWGRLVRRHGDDPEQDPERVSAVAAWILLGVFGGARLMYVAVEVAKYWSLENPTGREIGAQFLKDPLSILAVWNGGLVMYGGLLGGIGLGLWAVKREGMEPRNALDTGLVAGFFAQTIGRWGCFFVGDDYGRVVPERLEHLPFPLTIRVPSLEWLAANPKSLFDETLAGEIVWATQVWMSLNALAIALVGLWLLRRRRYRGQVAQWMLVHYAVMRFVIESFRGDTVRGVWLGGLSTSQILSVPLLLLGIILLVRDRRRRDVLPAT